MMEKVVQVGEIRVHPAMLDARSEDAPSGYVHVVIGLAVEDRRDEKGKLVVDVFHASGADRIEKTPTGEEFKPDFLLTSPRALELANELRALAAQEVADKYGLPVRCAPAKAAAYVQPRAG